MFLYYSIEEIKQIINKIINEFELNFKIKGLTLSCGIAKGNSDIKNEIDFINKADEALYYVKNNGKNNIKADL